MKTWPKFVVAALLAWHVADSVAVRPDYLAYFGPQVGGADRGYQQLVDSSLDWGMDLPELKRWLDAHNAGPHPVPLFLAYFGTDSVQYHGIQATRLPGFFDRRPPTPYAVEPGYYAISATLFQGIYQPTFGRWNATYERIYRAKLRSVERLDRTAGDARARAQLLREKPATFWENEYRTYDYFRFGRLCAWLRHQGPPPHHVGHAIFIWKLDSAALQAALLGPPAEWAETPVEWRRLLGQR